VFECSRDFHVVPHPQEQGTGVAGQLADQMPPESQQIEAAAGHKRCHPGAAVRSGDRHAINGSLPDFRKRADHLRNLRRRNILAFPPEGIADAIDKIVESPGILPHQVTRPNPGIPGFEYATQNLLL
jgi:hypothetical protein